MNLRQRHNITLGGPGDGPVLMLAHGFGCDQNMWRLVTPELERQFRVLLFDHVGMGRSDLSVWDERRYATLDGYADDVLRICREPDRFAALVLTVEPATGGHPPALLIRADRTVAYQTMTGGALIGILADTPIRRRTLRLTPGDTLVLYSDGLTEARTGDGRFGSAGLEAFLTGRPSTDAAAVVNGIVDLLTTFAEGVDDDVAVMALSVTRK